MLLKKKKAFRGYGILIFSLFLIVAHRSFSQQEGEIFLRGTVYHSATKKPVAAGSVSIIEIKKRVTANANGEYAIGVPRPGIYTVLVQSEGLSPYRKKIAINQNETRDFALSAPVFTDRGITITGRRDVQKVSRHTMTRKQIKDVPAGLGDSINAIVSLPGVVRTGGDLFGPIVVRGGDLRGVRYLVDEIPVYSPLHYGGLHSIINTNLIREISLLSSGFPAEIGSATAAVISMNTVDSVKEFGGYTDLSILSATLLIQTPILRNEGGGISIGSPLAKPGKEQVNAGYIIASGRIGYIDFIVLPLMKLITGSRVNVVPRYWDYQLKAKYDFNSNHSLTLFALGTSDYVKYKDNYTIDFDSDPLASGVSFSSDQRTFGQSLYYIYQPDRGFSNRITFFSSLKQSHSTYNIPAPGVSIAFKGSYIDSMPYVFGLTDKFKITAVRDILEIRGGIEYNLYYFTARGRWAQSIGRSLTSDVTQGNYIPFFINEKIFNSGLGGYVETKITYKGLTVMPGYRSDYLSRTGEVTWDPRCLISYEFPTGTTISAAGGKYSNFFQTNPMHFDGNPQYAKIRKYGKSEWALHRTAGLEQAIGLFKIKAEGFYNEFFRMVQNFIHIGPDGSLRLAMSTGKIRAYGAEVMLKKDRRGDENGLFGWISYTYTRSRFKSGLPYFNGLYDSTESLIANPWVNRWINYRNEQNHSLKIILGYAHEAHTVTGKFQLFTPSPYTPVVFSQEDMQFYNSTRGNAHRYYPVYGKPNSRHYPLNHRLDLRYSHTSNHSWGHVSWYVEVINVLNHRPIAIQRWNYWLPYHSRISVLHSANPKLTRSRFEIALIPNFGVEVKF